jgi:hypothetical protein
MGAAQDLLRATGLLRAIGVGGPHCIRRYPPGKPGGAPAAATKFLMLVQKMRQALTFLATIENDDHAMKTLAVISILALLTISGAVYTDQLLTSDQRTAQRVQ